MILRDDKSLARAAQIYARYASHADNLPPTREHMAKLGLEVWKHSYKLSPEDDMEAFQQLINWAADKSEDFAATLMIPSEQIGTLGAARWADQGFPRFIMPHTYAAALMATSIDDEVIEYVRPPYRAFLIDVPDDLLSIWNEKTQRNSKVRWILVHHVLTQDGEYRWQYVAHTEDSMCLWRHGLTTRQIASVEDMPVNGWEGAPFLSPSDDRDDRIATLIGRLVIGVCLAVQTPGECRPSPGNCQWSPTRNLDKRDPDLMTFKMGRPLKIDCREDIRDYVEGKKSNVPTVRTKVRGHWKAQPYGPQHSLRKPIWVMPYWRGPDGAPVLVRPVQL